MAFAFLRISATQPAQSLSLEPVWTAVVAVASSATSSERPLLGTALIMPGLVISEPGSTTLLLRHA